MAPNAGDCRHMPGQVPAMSRVHDENVMDITGKLIL
jgi:hypothetical protein